MTMAFLTPSFIGNLFFDCFIGACIAFGVGWLYFCIFVVVKADPKKAIMIKTNYLGGDNKSKSSLVFWVF